MRISDWSSDVCSSDLRGLPSVGPPRRPHRPPLRQRPRAGRPRRGAPTRRVARPPRRRVRRDSDPGWQRLHLVRRGQPPRPHPPSGPDPPPSRPLTPPNSPRNPANLRHPVAVSPTVVPRFVGGLEISTLLRRFADFSSPARRSSTFDSPPSTL